MRYMISFEDLEKIRQFYREINPSELIIEKGGLSRISPWVFAGEVASVMDTYPWEQSRDSFDRYIERETHYRMVREADGEGPSTLNLSPEAYQQRRDATIQAFVRHCVNLMNTLSSDGRNSNWTTSKMPPKRVTSSLTYI